MTISMPKVAPKAMQSCPYVSDTKHRAEARGWHRCKHVTHCCGGLSSGNRPLFSVQDTNQEVAGVRLRLVFPQIEKIGTMNDCQHKSGDEKSHISSYIMCSLDLLTVSKKTENICVVTCVPEEPVYENKICLLRTLALQVSL